MTLILANLDIIEADIGKNEWLDDIRAEGERMNALVKQLVMLTRMDEEKTDVNVSAFSLSDAITDTVSEFKMLAEEKGKPIFADVQPGITYTGDEAEIRRVISILLDNALKYCDKGGSIFLALTAKRHPVILSLIHIYTGIAVKQDDDGSQPGTDSPETVKKQTRIKLPQKQGFQYGNQHGREE